MNIVLVFPPQWCPTQPCLGLPSLTAYLRANGYHANQRDLNIESYDAFLSREYLCKIRERILKRWEYLDSKDILLPQQQREYCKQFQATLYGLQVIDQINDAKGVLRDAESFYDFSLYVEALKTIQMALKMVSVAYHPSELTLSRFEMKSPLLLGTDLLAATENEQENPFISLFKDHFLQNILSEHPDILGISIIGPSQVVPGLTLARLIKLHNPDVYVVLGGSIFTRLVDRLKEWSEIFGRLFDGVIAFEGEIPLLELCRCLESGQNLGTVPNLAYKQNECIRVNEFCFPERIDSLPTPCFDDLPLDQYFSPRPILPILTSRGCYWGQCAFCDHGEIYGGRYCRRPVDILAEDLQILSSKHSTKFFTFNDEAIAPTSLLEISNAIISKDLELKCNADIRLEPQFSHDLFQLASRAGFYVLYCGLESGHDRVLAHMCKGIDCQTAQTVLQNSSDAGIWNHVFAFFGFPTET